MDLEDLQKLNREGLIPGPGESEQRFLERQALVKQSIGCSGIPAAYWDWANVQLRSLFDFTPKWCAATLSSKGLALWQGAATWIDVKRIYTIQISQRPWVRFLIDRDELLAHEAAHAARAAFDEAGFEEVFAYLTSSAKWRRIVGPLFQRPIEALGTVLLLTGGALLQVAEIIWERPFFAEIPYLITAFLFLLGSFRCLKKRVLINRAASRIKPFLKDPSQALAVLFRMTDVEIRCVAKGDLPRPKEELRWRLLKAAYFRDDFVNE